MNLDSLEFWIIVSVYILFNLIALSVMIWDKKRAIKEKRRISEGDLFLIAICFGALGVLLGMWLSRHKTNKLKFVLGVPLALAQNISILFLIYQIYK